MKKVFVFGLGWLGNIVKQFENEFNLIVAGTTATGKAGTIQWEIGDDIPKEISGCYVVVAIPASKWNEPDLIKFTEQIKQFNIASVLWVSSIGVYPEGIGLQFSESTILDENKLSEKGKRLIWQENLITSAFNSACVLRLGGLFGYQRHPANYFLNDRPIENAEAKANMIHGDDAARLVLTCIVQEITGIVNGVPPNAVSRSKFYLKAFEFLQLGTPNLINDNIGKHITSEYINIKFPFNWKYQSPIDAYEMEN